MKIEQMSPSASLTLSGLDYAVSWYVEVSRGIQPTTLLVAPDLVQRAYELIHQMKWLPAIVPVPGMLNDNWAVIGSHGVFWSDPI